jgi:hypothetical protein
MSLHQLKLTYYDASSRIIRLDGTYMMDRNGNELSSEELKTKALITGHSFGKRLFKLVLISDGRVLVRHYDVANKPNTSRGFKHKVSKRFKR